MYLPATFIYHDLAQLNFAEQILNTYNPTGSYYQAWPLPNGNMVMKYTCGLAILYSPFFFIGHLFAQLLQYPADGFSLPYQVAIAMGSLCYALLGLWVMRRVLLYLLPDKVAALTLAVLVLGTNHFQLTVYDTAMPHNYLFTIYAIVLWLTIKWYQRPRAWVAALLGLAIGLACL